MWRRGRQREKVKVCQRVEACVDERERERGGERVRSNHEKNWKRTGNKKKQHFRSSLHLQLFGTGPWQHRVIAAGRKWDNRRIHVGQCCAAAHNWAFQLNFLFLSHLRKSFSPSAISRSHPRPLPTGCFCGLGGLKSAAAVEYSRDQLHVGF